MTVNQPGSEMRFHANRTKLATTVHSDTMPRLAELCKLYQTSQGRVIDKLVETLYRSVKDVKVLCIHGSNCVAGRTDIPRVL